MTVAADETDQLRHYVLAKQQVAAAIRRLKQWLDAHHDAERAEQAQALLIRLAEDRFNLVVVGQFKRGKSSLMNAVIGRDLLPTGLLPLTSAITTLCYGPQERVVLRRKGWAVEPEITLDALADYITERGNPGNEKGLIEARVELPIAFLRRGLHFIDTPGVGSSQPANTATTYAFLPQADAVVFVTSVEAPLSATERTFLQDIRAHVRKLFIIVNKIDLLSAAERRDVLEYIRAQLNTLLGTTNLPLYPVSARQALEAKRSGDQTQLQQSGLVEMETALTSFLAREQGRTFLARILDRGLTLLAERADDGSRAPGDTLIPERLDQTVDDLRQTMETLRSALLESMDIPQVVAGNGSVADAAAPLEQAVAASQAERPRNAPRGGTCPICTAQSQALFDFFARWQYALASSTAAQQAFIASHGFCPAHTWQFQPIASPQGISDGYAPLIEAVAAQVRQLLDRSPEEAAQQVTKLLGRPASCAACRVLRETETAQVRQLLTRIATRDGRAAYTSAEGLCLPHLRTALASAGDRELARFLLQEQLRRLEEIAEDMRSYTLKRDAFRRGLLNTLEKTAWRRALVQMAGEQTVGASGAG